MSILDNSVYIEEAEKTLGLRLTEVKVSTLDTERKAMYASFFAADSGDDWEILSVVGKDRTDDELKEIIVGVSQRTARVVVPTVSCQISYEDLSLSQCPEYRFEDDPQWRIAQLSLLALDDFKLKKFKLWEHQINEPECEAAFRRLLQQGPIRNVFDKFIFPSSEEIAKKYKVTDEHSGKTVDVPHQVSEMRIWSPSTGVYETLDCSLVGAPKNDGEAMEYWTKKMREMVELRGREYIESLIGPRH